MDEMQQRKLYDATIQHIVALNQDDLLDITEVMVRLLSRYIDADLLSEEELRWVQQLLMVLEPHRHHHLMLVTKEETIQHGLTAFFRAINLYSTQLISQPNLLAIFSAFFTCYPQCLPKLSSLLDRVLIRGSLFANDIDEVLFNLQRQLYADEPKVRLAALKTVTACMRLLPMVLRAQFAESLQLAVPAEWLENDPLEATAWMQLWEIQQSWLEGKTLPNPPSLDPFEEPDWRFELAETERELGLIASPQYRTQLMTEWCAILQQDDAPTSQLALGLRIMGKYVDWLSQRERQTLFTRIQAILLDRRFEFALRAQAAKNLTCYRSFFAESAFKPLLGKLLQGLIDSEAIIRRENIALLAILHQVAANDSLDAILESFLAHLNEAQQTVRQAAQTALLQCLPALTPLQLWQALCRLTPYIHTEPKGQHHAKLLFLSLYSAAVREQASYLVMPA